MGSECDLLSGQLQYCTCLYYLEIHVAAALLVPETTVHRSSCRKDAQQTSVVQPQQQPPESRLPLQQQQVPVMELIMPQQVGAAVASIAIKSG